MKLNLGCGKDYQEGFVNVDSSSITEKVDLSWDLKKSLPYADNSVECVRAIAVLEHFNKFDYIEIFKDWCRILKFGGELIIKVPDIENIIKAELPTGKKILLIYGDPKFKGLNLGDSGVHKWGFTEESLRLLFKENGLEVNNIKHTDIQGVNILIKGIKNET